jgi:hypothetical protein
MDHADTRLESGAQLLCDKVWSAHGELHVKTSYTKKFPDSELPMVKLVELVI